MELLNRRREMGRKLPYDYEVEYLESTGTQWIDTGISPKAYITSVEFVLNLTQIPTSTVVVFGARYNSDPNRGSPYNLFMSAPEGIGKIRNDWSYKCDVAPYKVNEYPLSAVLISNKDILIKLNADSSSEIDGDIFSVSRINKANIPYNLFIGQVCSGGSPINLPSVSCKWKYCKIWENSFLVRNLISVVKDNVGYMYDKVSGRLFGNAGTGQFIVGPRITSGGGVSA